MLFKSDQRPICKGCGKPIAKHTTSVLFGQSTTRSDDWTSYRTEHPRSIEEVQRLVNQKIISVRWTRHVPNEFVRTVGKPEFDYIDTAKLWDGETYIDEHFHAQQCAVLLGRAMAAKGWAM